MRQLQHIHISPVNKSRNKKQSNYGHAQELFPNAEQAPKEDFYHKKASQKPKRSHKERAVRPAQNLHQDVSDSRMGLVRQTKIAAHQEPECKKNRKKEEFKN